MPKIIVEVMPKAELLDPQGKAVGGALSRLGHSAISEVRIGKRFELTIEGEITEQLLAEVDELAKDIFSNQVIEDVVKIYVAEEAAQA